MTFTEAAVEVLRRAGKPLHFKQIAQDAVSAGLLSHVGQTPETTMGARLLAMARREHDRKVIATETGVFALAEWGLAPANPLLEAPSEGAVDETPYRTRERHPPLQDEYTPGGRRDERRRHRDEEEEGRRKKRYAPPSEVAHALLREKGEPLTLEELAKALREKDRIAEALERDLASFEKALREENRRRQDSGRAPLFEFDDGRVKGLEIPKEQPRAERRPERAERPERKEKERREEPRPMLLDEQRRQVLRSVRRRLSSLDISALERIAVALLEAQGYRELNMARRSAKEGPLYLARHRWGAGELRYAVRVLRPGRDLGRNEVQELRRDLSHYSAQIGIAFGTGECSREAKGEANTPNGAPVMLYGAEAFAEALIDAGLGVSKRLIEWIDYDDEFFAAMGAGEALAETPEEPLPPAPAPEAAPAAEAERPRRRDRDRDRRRDRERRRDERPEGAPEAAPEAEAVPESTPAGESAVEAPAPEAAPAAEPPAAAASEAPAPAEAPAVPQESAPAAAGEAPAPAEAAPASEPAPENPASPEATGETSIG